VVELPVSELLFVATMGAVYSLLALGLSVQWGYAGLFNAGVAGFWALGAYALALLGTPPQAATFVPGHAGLDLPWLVGAAGAGLAAALLGLAIAYPTLGLRTDYLAIATLGLAEILRLVIVHGGDVTAGTFGIGGIPRPLDLQEPLASDAVLALVALALMAGVLLALEYTGRSPWGRVLKAIREDEDAAEALGKDVRRYKLQAFALGCAVMGLAGALFASLQRVIEPRLSFTPLDTFLVFTMVLLGGQGNHKGAVVGAWVLWLFVHLSVRARDLLPSFLAVNVEYLRFIAIGALLVALVLARPQGLWPEERVISTKA
jgi:branched-chain amino acid transport system permease protein